MIVVVTEKPSVAREIAAFLGAKQKRNGFFEGKGYQVTWAFGHLVTQNQPEDYRPEWKRWTTTHLPMIPETFQLKCREDKGSRDQLKVIYQLIKKCDRLICATDAGREGELIFRNILRILKQEEKPFERLWLSSMTEEAIKEGFNSLKPGTNYDNLYHAARCRSEADWIVGINGTRNLTVRYGQSNLWSMGRVQTPVLAMLAERDDEIATFQAEPFWELCTKYKDALFKSSGKKFKDKVKVEELLKKIQGELFKVDKISKKREKSHPPLLFDLTELQREMNQRHGTSAADTLAAAQSLYESKIITYPRTDSQYLSSDMKGRIPPILKNLQKNWQKEIEPLALDKLAFSKRIVNDKKVTDHHAIIPTGRVPGVLPGTQQHVFDVVARRFIAVFYPTCEKDVTTVDGSSAGVGFRARGVTMVTPGWTALYESKDKNQLLPEFEKGESGPHVPEIKEGKSSPPKHYNENTLLGAMAAPGKHMEDEELKEALKERGIGTPATRASIIETLIGRQYIKRAKKNLLITPLGRYLIAIVQDPQLKSAELTGNWECQLKQIEKGKLSAEKFMDEIGSFTRSFLEGSDIFNFDRTQIGSCPLSGHQVIKGKKGVGCSDWKNGCSFKLEKEYKGVQLKEEQIQRLIQQRVILSPITLPSGDKVHLALTAKGKIIEIPPPPVKSKSPKVRLKSGKAAAAKGSAK